MTKVVDFYKTRSAGSPLKPLEKMALEVDKFCYTRGDEKDIKTLYTNEAARSKERVLYINVMSVYDPHQQALLEIGSDPICSDLVRRNNIGWFTCTDREGFTTSFNGKPFVVNVRDNVFAPDSNTWFLRHKDSGEPVYSGEKYPGKVYLDLGNPDVRAKAKEVIDSWAWENSPENDTWYDAIFFDDWDTRFDALTSKEVELKNYKDSNKWWKTQLDVLDDFYAYAQSRTGNLGKPGKLFINLQGNSRNKYHNERWKQAFVKEDGTLRVSGGMLEWWVLSSDGDYEAANKVAFDLNSAKYVLDHGGEIWVSIPLNPEQIEEANKDYASESGNKALFATVCYFLVKNDNCYVHSGSEYSLYTPLTIIDKLKHELGNPVSDMTNDGNVYSRVFEKGILTVNINTRQVSIELNSFSTVRPLKPSGPTRQRR